MNIQRDVVYNAAHGVRGLGDVFLPAAGETADDADNPPRNPVLLIHGGGWNAMTKESIEPFARLFAATGRPVFNINYRLLDHGPWPACLDDCLAAARFVLGGKLAPHGVAAPPKLLVCGASAGGHLAMMTGLQLGAANVERIVSISGPSRLNFPDGSKKPHLKSPAFCHAFFGRPGAVTPQQIAAVSPASCVHPGSPPLLCIHSENDRLVPISHSHDAVTAWRAAGCDASLIAFAGPGDSHGIWNPAATTNDLSKRQPINPVAQAIANT